MTCRPLIAATFLAASPALADTASDRRGETAFHDPSIAHAPSDGVVRLYGAGGPHTAFRKVADLWTERTGTEVEVIAGPESDWTAEAQASADILWGTSEQSMTASSPSGPPYVSTSAISLSERDQPSTRKPSRASALEHADPSSPRPSIPTVRSRASGGAT